jgi:hypothetical protein
MEHRVIDSRQRTFCQLSVVRCEQNIELVVRSQRNKERNFSVGAAFSRDLTV